MKYPKVAGGNWAVPLSLASLLIAIPLALAGCVTAELPADAGGGGAVPGAAASVEPSRDDGQSDLATGVTPTVNVTGEPTNAAGGGTRRPAVPTAAPTATLAPAPTATAPATGVATDTATATAAPTAATTLCPFKEGGIGVVFYSDANYSGTAWTLYVPPGNNDTYTNLPAGLAGHLGSFVDTNNAWHVVLYQSTGGSGNLGHYDASWATVDTYWQATQSVKVYVNRTC